MKKIILSLIVCVSCFSVSNAAISFKDVVKTAAVAGFYAETGYCVAQLTKAAIKCIESYTQPRIYLKEN